MQCQSTSMHFSMAQLKRQLKLSLTCHSISRRPLVYRIALQMYHPTHDYRRTQLYRTSRGRRPPRLQFLCTHRLRMLHSRSSDLRSSDSYTDRSCALALSKAPHTAIARNPILRYRLPQIAQSFQHSLNARLSKNTCIMKILRNNI